MYVVVDHRPSVTEAYTSSFASEGLAALGLQPDEFREWFTAASPADVEGMQSVVVGEFEGRASCSELVRRRTQVPILALAEVRNLSTTLELLSAGVDDVVRMPVHVREIIARSNAIWRRINRIDDQVSNERIKVFFDGRDIEIDGEPMILPRRERRILEFLAKNAHRRVTKSQIFNAVYGPFEESVDEIVVEGHVSKLRKKLRLRLGYDVIDAKRYLGYQFVGGAGGNPSAMQRSSLRAALPSPDDMAAKPADDRPIALVGREDGSGCREQLARALERGGPVAVHCLRVDVAGLEESERQAIGGAVSSEVTGRISRRIRGSDMIHPQNSDEMILIQSNIGCEADALGFARRIVEAASSPFEFGGRRFEIRVSAGIAVAPRHGTDVETILAAAGKALRQGGRDADAAASLLD